MEIVARIKEFVKTRQKEIILGIAVFLISLLSFGVGYLVAREQFKQPLIIEQQYGEAQ